MPCLRRQLLLMALLVSSAGLCSPSQAADNGCRTGGSALAAAYVLADPIYATVLGEELLPFLARNKEHFQPRADSLRCAEALSNAYAQESARVTDPELQSIREQKRRDLESQGIPIGPVQPDASGEYLLISAELNRLAEGLAPAAAGDLHRLQRPANDVEASKRMRADKLAMLMRIPLGAAIVQAIRPDLAQMRELDRQMIGNAAASLADLR